MRYKELIQPSVHASPYGDLEQHVDFSKIDPKLLQTLASALHRSMPDVEIDRSVLVQTMYGVDADDDLGDSALGSLGAEMSALMSSGMGAEWDLDDLVTDPLEKEAQELENKLLQQKIETERAQTELVRARSQQALSASAEAVAKAETARSFLPYWKK
jgi:hypothetical protein